MDSEVPFYNLSQEVPSYPEIPGWVRRIDAFLLIVITITGIIGNSLVCLAYAWSSKIRTKTNVFVVNLAFADFLTCLSLPVIAWSQLVETESQISHVSLPCSTVFVVTQSFIGSSILTLALIAVNRWILISGRKELYVRLYRSRNISVFLLATWVVPLFVSIMPLTAGIGQTGYDAWSHNCALLREHPYSYLYVVVVLCTLVPLPMAVITFSYWSIFRHVRAHTLKVHELSSKTISGAVVRTKTSNSRGRVKRRSALSRHQVQITKNLCLVVVTFVLCLSPYMLVEFCKAGPIMVNQTKILAVLNSCLNPILYAVKHPHFRRVFCCILRNRWRTIR